MISIAFHVGILTALVAADLWRTDRLDAPRAPSSAVALAMPVLTDGGGGAPAPREVPRVESRPRRVTVRDVVQPVAVVRNPLRDIALTFESEGGRGDGLGRGEGHGVGDGACWSGSCSSIGTLEVAALPPRPPPVTVDSIPSVELAALRISGATHIEPSDDRKLAMVSERRLRVVAELRVCISERGDVTSVDVGASSGYADYDARLIAAARGWRYRPHTVDGVARAACAPVRFDYRLTATLRRR